MLTFDYETEGIVGNPVFNPPRPVGVSIKIDDQPSRYLGWGHPTENNCSFEDGKGILLASMRLHQDWLAHNKAFEAAVSKKHFGVVKKRAERFHDTQFLLFLTDPYAFSLSLKPSAERVLGWAPEEQDELRDWILANVPGTTTNKKSPMFWAAFICKAPGKLVGRYACGDTDRTYALFNHLHPTVVENDMEEAYIRELKLEPILSDSSRKGVRVDMKGLERDIPIYTEIKTFAEDYIRTRLGDFNIDSDVELANALEQSDQVTEWVLTPTGKRSTARKNLAGRIKDPDLLAMLGYRGVLATCLGTFAKPWLDKASATGGRLHAQWNQVRGDRGSGNIDGTRTGRPSCKEPNLTNIPNDFEDFVVPPSVRRVVRALSEKHRHTFHDIIHMRQYLLPEEGHVWLKRDFDAQEMRWLAHFTEGKLYEAFHKDPKTDPHEAVKKIIFEFSGLELSRKHTKITGFGIMYGRGIPNLSTALGVDIIKGAATRAAYYAALPEVQWLANETRNMGRTGSPIITWGGRRYYREPNPERDLSYKLLNYLIQGSAADQTKESIVVWNEYRGPNDHLLATIYDENNISAPKDGWKASMKILRETMDADRADVPFCSKGYTGLNWDEIKECE